MTGSPTPLAFISFDADATLWDRAHAQAPGDLTALADLHAMAPLGVMAAAWEEAQAVQARLGFAFAEVVVDPGDGHAAMARKAARHGASGPGSWLHVTSDPTREAAARAAGAHVAFVPRSGADSGRLAMASEAEILVSDLHQLVRGLWQTHGSPVRYDVTVTAAHPKFLREYVKWLAAEHGERVLASPGCREFRAVVLDETTARAEYLFRDAAALRDYRETAAIRMRAEILERFPADWLSFSRTEARVVATRLRPPGNI